MENSSIPPTLIGGTAVTYRFPAEGGPMEYLWIGDLDRETPDGKYILYKKTNGPGIFRRSLAGDPVKNPEELLVPDFWSKNQFGGYTPVANGFYYVSGNAEGKPGPFRFYDYGARKSIDVAPAVPDSLLGSRCRLTGGTCCFLPPPKLAATCCRWSFGRTVSEPRQATARL